MVEQKIKSNTLEVLLKSKNENISPRKASIIIAKQRLSMSAT